MLKVKLMATFSLHAKSVEVVLSAFCHEFMRFQPFGIKGSLLFQHNNLFASLRESQVLAYIRTHSLFFIIFFIIIYVFFY